MTIPNEINIYFDDDKPPVKCESIKEIDATLDLLHNQSSLNKSPLAIAIKVFDHEIDIGLGTELTFVCLQIAPCDGEYYLAVGDHETGEVQRFYGAGQDCYWQPKNLIPIEIARSAVRYFIENQSRIPSVHWQDWNNKNI